MDEALSPEDEALAYRSLSPLAVAGLVLGVLSCVALLSPALSLIPVVAAVVSVAGLIAVWRSPDTRVGQSFALSGLALAVAVGVAVQTRAAVAKRLHVEASAVLADRFVEAIAAGDDVAAHELTLSLRYRRPSQELAELYYESDTQAAEQLADFREDAAVGALARGGATLTQASEIQTKTGGSLLAYRVYGFPVEDEFADRSIVLELKRTPARLAGPTSWWVSKYSVRR